METRANVEVTIIGAGLTGLSLAWFLKKKGISFRIIEKNTKTGGVVQTQEIGDFVFEKGPNTGLVSNHAVDTLLEDMSDIGRPESARKESKSRWIWKSGRWHKLPSGVLEGISTPLFSLKDKFRLLGEPFRSRGDNPLESVAEMVRRRLGKSYLDYAVDPFISGVYAGDPSYLVTKYALPKLYTLEQNYGSFIKGAIIRGRELQHEKLARKRSGIFSFYKGLHNLIEALTTKIGTANLLTHTDETVISQSETVFTVQTDQQDKTITWKSKHVVSTVDAEQLATLFPFLAPSSLEPILTLEYAKIIQVSVGYSHWEGIQLNAYGGLIPSQEKRKTLGILFPSSIFKDRAPDKGALLSIFLGGFRHPEMLDLDTGQIEDIVLKEIADTLHHTSHNPQFIRVHRYPRAIPQYGPSSVYRLESIQSIENQFQGIHLAGSIRDGIGMADRILQAYLLSEKIRTDN